MQTKRKHGQQQQQPEWSKKKKNSYTITRNIVCKKN